VAGQKSPLSYFVLVFALSIPFWLIGALSEQGLPLPMNLPLSALGFVCPLLAALILVSRENGLHGTGQLLARVFDYRRIKDKAWYIPIILLMPTVYLLSYGVMRMLRLPLPEPHVPFLTVPILFAVFFLSAACEEVGWMGYAADLIQERCDALATGIVLGAVWGLWHVVPDIQARHGPEWIVWQRGVYDIALRVVIVWIYNNAGKSVFAAILVHDMDDVSWSLFPNNGSHYDPAVTGVITAVIAVIVTYLWGAKTLARFRY
jgi:membrane protease YdiL (CAAX protease family)